jgi:hypothetical protein
MSETKAKIRCFIGVSFYFPPDRALQDKAAAKLRKILLERSLMERWEPVAQEMKWVIVGRPNAAQHQNILPGYCYNIFDLYARTTFKTFTPLSEVLTITDNQRAATAKTVEEARAVINIDWEKLGSVFSMGEQAMMFFEKEAEPMLKRDGLLDLPPEKDKELYQLLIGDRWMKAWQAKMQALDKDKPVEEIIEKQIITLEETTKKAVPEWHQKARDWEPGATTKFHAGAAKGSAGFIDQHGQLHGERKIKHKNTYEMLLICWPEIEEMIKTNKRMEDLWNWLLPFSHPYWIEIQDLDQLVSLARSIKLKLKKAGRPPKPRKC